MLYFIKKLNHVLQEINKLNVPTEINTIINFYNISKTLAINITGTIFPFHFCIKPLQNFVQSARLNPFSFLFFISNFRPRKHTATGMHFSLF